MHALFHLHLPHNILNVEIGGAGTDPEQIRDISGAFALFDQVQYFLLSAR